MREAIFILFILLILVGFTVYRYRKQLRFGLDIWRALRSARDLSGKAQETQLPPRATSERELVTCAKCSSWIPEGDAIRFGKRIYYCSARCLEAKTKV